MLNAHSTFKPDQRVCCLLDNSIFFCLWTFVGTHKKQPQTHSRWNYSAHTNMSQHMRQLLHTKYAHAFHCDCGGSLKTRSRFCFRSFVWSVGQVILFHFVSFVSLKFIRKLKHTLIKTTNFTMNSATTCIFHHHFQCAIVFIAVVHRWMPIFA